MTERPILFSAPMVRALLDGRKTQTRRIVKRQPPAAAVDAGVIMSGNPASNGVWCWLDGADLMEAGPVGDDFRCPYGVPGDRLWVKESGLHKRGPLFELFIHDATPDRYWASPDHGGDKLTPDARGKRGAGIGSALTRDQHKGMGFKALPSIHMPRWASRLTLEITDVRVERLQDISEADAEAEGVQDPSLVPILGAFWNSRDGYARLWEHINGKGSWAANPWVWAVSFRVAS